MPSPLPPPLFNLSLTGESFSGRLVRNLTGEELVFKNLARLPAEPEIEKPRLLKRGLVSKKGCGYFTVTTLEPSYSLPERSDSIVLLVQPIVCAMNPARSDLYFPTRSSLCEAGKYDGFGQFKTYSQLFSHG